MGKRPRTEAFGKKVSFKEADLILIPAPWEATVSYTPGTSQGPELIRKASSQLDFFSPEFGTAYNHQIHFEASDSLIETLNKQASSWAREVQAGEEERVLSKKDLLLCEKVNQAGESLLDWIYERARAVFEAGKIPALVGGEHSVSEGLLRFVGEKYKGEYGILHIDAHADLRNSYQGFKYSHAGVMNNVLNLKYAPKKLVQVSVRDLSEEEYKKIQEDSRIDCFFDERLSARLFKGEKWAEICSQIVELLPSYVYVSLDVDGLSREYAPGTGTPVPGGLSFQKALYLFSEIKRQKKKLISFDVVETAGEEWNGNVSARLIYYLAGLALDSQSGS